MFYSINYAGIRQNSWCNKKQVARLELTVIKYTLDQALKAVLEFDGENDYSSDQSTRTCLCSWLLAAKSACWYMVWVIIIY